MTAVLWLLATVTKAPAISFCQDGATHMLHGFIGGAIRLKAANKQALADLQTYTDAKVWVTICGYWKRGGECEHLSVYAVALATSFAAMVKGMK